MARNVNPATNHSRTTDHSEEIRALRDAWLAQTERQSHRTAILYRAAADLLEVHDETGISLDDWDGPRNLVNLALSDLGLGGVLPNGV